MCSPVLWSYFALNLIAKCEYDFENPWCNMLKLFTVCMPDNLTEFTHKWTFDNKTFVGNFWWMGGWSCDRKSEWVNLFVRNWELPVFIFRFHYTGAQWIRGWNTDNFEWRWDQYHMLQMGLNCHCYLRFDNQWPNVFIFMSINTLLIPISKTIWRWTINQAFANRWRCKHTKMWSI